MRVMIENMGGPKKTAVLPKKQPLGTESGAKIAVLGGRHRQLGLIDCYREVGE